jgi:multimeric flavodoxin WrbA
MRVFSVGSIFYILGPCVVCLNRTVWGRQLCFLQNHTKINRSNSAESVCMKITILYGNTRKETTFHLVDTAKSELIRVAGEHVIFEEYSFPRDMPHPCSGCFLCLEKGVSYCPHAALTQPIIESLAGSDGILLATPVQSLDISSAMKSFLDHMCYMWLPHRPDERMFTKAVMCISQTAGAGHKNALKTLQKHAKYWGAARIYGYCTRALASRWAYISDKEKAKMTKEVQKTTRHFAKAVAARSTMRPRLFTRLMFFVMGKMISGYKENDLQYTDTLYWRDKGWLSGKSPFKK